MLAATKESENDRPKDPEEALAMLRAGNQRFVTGKAKRVPVTPQQLATLEKGQHPFATILGCSDSRVPIELIFDQGLGDLFVIRVAGNIAAPSQIGSVEFAAEKFGTRLVVVMGHSVWGYFGHFRRTWAPVRRPVTESSFDR